jgi:hypothetical protein
MNGTKGSWNTIRFERLQEYNSVLFLGFYSFLGCDNVGNNVAEKYPASFTGRS